MNLALKRGLLSPQPPAVMLLNLKKTMGIVVSMLSPSELISMTTRVLKVLVISNAASLFILSASVKKNCVKVTPPRPHQGGFEA